ncbi:hypothetical protein HMPREF1598_03479 [Escherichia coli 907710]|nr:hypothetical protein HMPREF1590_02896 [Escherichia coli 113302]ESD18373.1 hypothetical protein HMPREF1598_03479 [Escherichia coli 907710]
MALFYAMYLAIFFCNFSIFYFSLRAAFHICNRIKNSAGVHKCAGVKRFL